MATMYIRRFNFKDSLSDAQVVDELKFLLNDVVPAVEKVRGVRACRVFSGAGALRADLTLTIDMDDGGVYKVCSWTLKSVRCSAGSMAAGI